MQGLDLGGVGAAFVQAGGVGVAQQVWAQGRQAGQARGVGEGVGVLGGMGIQPGAVGVGLAAVGAGGVGGQRAAVQVGLEGGQRGCGIGGGPDRHHRGARAGGGVRRGSVHGRPSPSYPGSFPGAASPGL
ncbi:hypothetical protein Pro02_62970 [Planobispora rosea]|uniref:Uncharacterized protein n=1 Tax=Planobispora rosea TaxID=35762 RepID=A0A8J3WF96_PLARO|nr:hypothetical protein Pro02_62970 [Planobispora rosea]